jgi:hypothetical protein
MKKLSRNTILLAGLIAMFMFINACTEYTTPPPTEYEKLQELLLGRWKEVASGDDFEHIVYYDSSEIRFIWTYFPNGEAYVGGEKSPYEIKDGKLYHSYGNGQLSPFIENFNCNFSENNNILTLEYFDYPNHSGENPPSTTPYIVVLERIKDTLTSNPNELLTGKWKYVKFGSMVAAHDRGHLTPHTGEYANILEFFSDGTARFGPFPDEQWKDLTYNLDTHFLYESTSSTICPIIKYYYSFLNNNSTLILDYLREDSGCNEYVGSVIILEKEIK